MKRMTDQEMESLCATPRNNLFEKMDMEDRKRMTDQEISEACATRQRKAFQELVLKNRQRAVANMNTPASELTKLEQLTLDIYCAHITASVADPDDPDLGRIAYAIATARDMLEALDLVTSK